MVPKVAKAGRSFKGAAQYYLHDKKADTSERVAFVQTVNLPTDDPRRAVAHMIDTAAHADQLKQAAGVKAGRNLQKPVYAYSLAWHPDQAPTQAQQIEAARESLEALGVADRQALIVSHNDQKHPHVHVIVNRVCAETGKAATMSNDRLKLSQWAEDYEKRHGKILCPQRLQNNKARKQGQWRKDNSPSRREHVEWTKQQTAEMWDDHRRESDKNRVDRKAQFDALWRQKEERFALRRDEIKHLYKPIWRDFLRRQEADLKDYDAGIHKRIQFAMRQHENKAAGLVKAVFNSSELRAEYVRFQEAERAGVADQQRQRIRDAGREVTKAWKYDRDVLRASHRAADQTRYEDTKKDTQALWDEIRHPKRASQGEEKRHPPELNAFERYVQKQREQQAARDALTNKAQQGFQQTADRRKGEARKTKPDKPTTKVNDFDEHVKRQRERSKTAEQNFAQSADRRKDESPHHSFDQDQTNDRDQEKRKANREKIRQRKERKRSRPRRRGDTGRTMDR